MRCLAAITFCLLSGLSPAFASTAPVWSDQDLARFAALVVRGHVATTEVGRDEFGIYTYVTLDVQDVLKGRLPSSRVVLKQLGGSLGDFGLSVPGQAQFEVGEDVIVFLEIRPRDRTLYTSAFWQGKWRVVRDAATGAQRVLRTHEGEPAAATDSRELAAMERVVRATAQDGESDTNIVVDPPDVRIGAPYVLWSNAARWMESTVAVDIQNASQPGLAGGGLSEIAGAEAQWNAVGASIQLLGGARRAYRCLNTNESDGRIVITFDDPCGEVSDSGSTVGYCYFYWTTAGAQTINGVYFRRMLQATITTNNTTNSRNFNSVSGCFHSVMLHELGHALGFDHETATASIMYPTISGACSSGPLGLSNGDSAGLLFVYPSTTATRPGVPQSVNASVAGSTLTVTWSAPTSGATPTAYRLQFLSGGAVILSTTVGAVTSTSLSIPSGTTGSFAVTVTALAGAIAGDPSNAALFTIGGGTPPASAPVNVQANVAGGTLAVSWNGVTGATTYRLDFRASGSGGIVQSVTAATTSLTLAIPAGITGTYNVVVTGLNSAGVGPSSSAIAFTISGGCTAPSTPAGLSGTLLGGVATASWTASAGASSYVVQAGTTAGASNLFNANIGNATGASANGLPAGFRAYVRVIAVNACGASAPSGDFLIQ